MIEAFVGLTLALLVLALGPWVVGLGLLVLAELLVQKTGRVGPWSVGHGAVGVNAGKRVRRWLASLVFVQFSHQGQACRTTPCSLQNTSSH